MVIRPSQQDDAPDPHEAFLRLWMQHEPELRAFVRRSCAPLSDPVAQTLRKWTTSCRK
jgi:hypothetical protein